MYYVVVLLIVVYLGVCVAGSCDRERARDGTASVKTVTTEGAAEGGSDSRKAVGFGQDDDGSRGAGGGGVRHLVGGPDVGAGEAGSRGRR
jgi:hypothetical protein